MMNIKDTLRHMVNGCCSTHEHFAVEAIVIENDKKYRLQVVIDDMS